MAFHHVALATADLAATHAFYTDAMGFELVKAVVAPTDHPGAWAKHVFYDTGGAGMIAFWELHDDQIDASDTAISTGLGLPIWVNHLSFNATDVDDLIARLEHWLGQGIDAMEIDHGFCRSVYTTDPNGILVEWCTDTVPYTEADRQAAAAALVDPRPPLEAPPVPSFHRARPTATSAPSVDAG